MSLYKKVHETLAFSKDQILFVGAHWDTYGLSPGFDDNGSGKEKRSGGTEQWKQKSRIPTWMGHLGQEVRGSNGFGTK